MEENGLLDGCRILDLRGCLKTNHTSTLVGEGLVPSQFAGAHKGLPYRVFWTPSRGTKEGSL